MSDSASTWPLPPARPAIRGTHTWLRPAERSDVAQFARWLADEDMLRWIARRAPIGVAEEERWFERMLEHQGREAWFFVICRLDDGRPIGTCDLDVDELNGHAGLGIGLGSEEDRGQGLGTDALQALVRFGFAELRLERIYLDVYTDNDRAIRSYEKGGFVREGVHRRAMYRQGRYLDVLRMAILRDEWQARVNPTAEPG